MNIFPAIDLYEGKAVRLVKGDYANMTVYSDDPVKVALGFAEKGAEYLHVVDLEGARDGNTPNFKLIKRIISESGLKTEVGGGIRSGETIEKYLNAGVSRVILGTAAVTSPEKLEGYAESYGEGLAVGVDLKDGYVSIKGWRETSGYSGDEFLTFLEKIGIKYVICTDISRDGMMKGTNHSLYAGIAKRKLNITASGGISGLEDIKKLLPLKIYGAIIGKALYTGAITLEEAICEAKRGNSEC